MAVKKDATKTDSVADKKPPVSSVKKEIKKKSEHGKGGRYETDRQTILCTYHKSDRPLVVSNYYRSNAGSIFGALKFIPVCKDCCNKIYNSYLFQTKNDYLQSIFFTCRRLDIRFDAELAEGALKHANGDLTKVFGWYMSSSNSLHQATSDANFDSSDGIDKAITPEEVLKRIRQDSKFDTEDKRNIADIKRKLGYDPFDSYAYSIYDLKSLYRDLLPHLDDDELVSDPLKLGIVIQLVNSMHIVKSLDFYMSGINNSPETFLENMTSVSQIINQRAKITDSITKIMKENRWLTTENANSKTKLSGMMRIYRELGIDKANENYFDMLTAESVKTVMDLSNKSIREQIRFSEVDENEIFQIQRELIDSKDKEILELKNKIYDISHENLRLQKVGD